MDYLNPLHPRSPFHFVQNYMAFNTLSQGYLLPGTLSAPPLNRLCPKISHFRKVVDLIISKGDFRHTERKTVAESRQNIPPDVAARVLTASTFDIKAQWSSLR